MEGLLPANVEPDGVVAEVTAQRLEPLSEVMPLVVEVQAVWEVVHQRRQRRRQQHLRASSRPRPEAPARLHATSAAATR